MRCVAEPRRSLRLFRLALFATISAAAAGCSSDTHRFDSNPFGGRQQASAQHPQEVTGTVQQQRSSSVQSQPLPPPTASAPATRPVAGGSSGGSPGMASYHPKNASPEITGSAHSATKSGWNWQGGTAITVQQGDTIDSITRRYGVPASAIAEANNLPNGSTLRPGQRLVIPKYEVTGSTVAPRRWRRLPRRLAPRPMISAPAVTAPAATGPHVHIIAPGETLMKLSRQYNKPLVEIARANNIPPSTLVKVGDRIVIPGLRGQQQAKTQPQAKPAPMAQASRNRSHRRSRSRPRLPPRRSSLRSSQASARARDAEGRVRADGCRPVAADRGERRHAGRAKSRAAEGQAGGDGGDAVVPLAGERPRDPGRSVRRPAGSRTTASTSRCRKAPRSRPPRTASWPMPATSSRPTAISC